MPLPLPGSPASSWAMFRQRIQTAFNGADSRVLIAFWLFGLINNVLYVIILSAALDLVGPTVPKGVVLLADVIPSFLVKLLAPYFVHLVPYSLRIVILVLGSTLGMLPVALTPNVVDGGPIVWKLIGVAVASLCSGGGELTFVGLVHYFGPFSLAAWGSGTGAAGLVGAGAYAMATTVFGLSVRNTLLASACLPVVMMISFFMILPKEPLHLEQVLAQNLRISRDMDDGGDASEGLLNSSTSQTKDRRHESRSSVMNVLVHNMRRAQSLFFPYMLPLLLVYIAEYTINQGVSPTLLFPLVQTPFQNFRAFYPAYNAIYQSGVFISRSSTPFFRVHNLYLPSFLQIANLVVLALHAMFDFIPSIYIVFAIIFWEGLLGGLVYVNTFAEISETVEKEDREFSLSATTVSDSGGVCIAGFISMGIEVALCNWQVGRGRTYCRQL